MCNNNNYGGYPYNRYPINYNNNHDCGCCFGNDFGNFPFGREGRRPPIHFENHRNRNHEHNHRRNIVRFREFEHDFEDHSYFDRRNNDREFDRGCQPFASPYGVPYYDNGYFDDWYNNGGY